jgi:hypothetical protein
MPGVSFFHGSQSKAIGRARSHLSQPQAPDCIRSFIGAMPKQMHTGSAQSGLTKFIRLRTKETSLKQAMAIRSKAKFQMIWVKDRPASPPQQLRKNKTGAVFA